MPKCFLWMNNCFLSLGLYNKSIDGNCEFRREPTSCWYFKNKIVFLIVTKFSSTWLFFFIICFIPPKKAIFNQNISPSIYRIWINACVNRPRDLILLFPFLSKFMVNESRYYTNLINVIKGKRHLLLLVLERHRAFMAKYYFL